VAHTHFIVLFRQNNCFIASVLIWLPTSELLIKQFYTRNTMPTTNLAVRVAGAVFGIAGEMRRLPPYFDNPDNLKKIGNFFPMSILFHPCHPKQQATRNSFSTFK